jgi:hypothetical protein
MKEGTLDSVLTDLGWKRAQSKWNPPVLISQESQMIKVPA